ncbi:ABC transporter ATP-binding protein [Pseudoduganella namucuonensis]|uniref:Amino acid/amide ABC transporter ATP-binding protein 2, HAAT family n=1 Tax=Pseudoduganella namucuonensis TaxID=1035707 RepID=A0A1I7LPB1_9BURK|nr:ABC transporter ATP-binding protein [Pseudoduganella namucuonensis]SFV11541.1 amino acid/amide ABC transporter ATP-binding protein 2, HAAT family [Pseudoduganella namucuonensis]
MSMLTVEGLDAGYGATNVLRKLSFSVQRGAIVALLGANGAGKTTALRALSGEIPARGRIAFNGVELAGLSAARRVELGLALVPQGRGTFTDFTVEENLELGAYTVASRGQIAADIERWYALFPRLRERRRQPAGTLSGGEQQMLAIARALMSRPRMLMCDEPSLGLAPAITQEMFAIFERVNAEQGTTILIVEQNAELTLRIASRGYVMEVGEIMLEGSAAELLASSTIQNAYLGA